MIARRHCRGRIPLRLLRGHVARRAQHLAGVGQFLRLVLPGRQAEVHDQGLIVAVEHRVRRLQIAMHDPLRVRVAERLRHLANDSRGPWQIGLLVFARRQIVLKRGALDECRRDVELIAILAILIERHDIWMPQIGRYLCFAQEPLDALRGVAALEFGHLQGDGTIELRIVGFVDIAERSFAQLAANLKSAHPLACLGSRPISGRALRRAERSGRVGIDRSVRGCFRFGGAKAARVLFRTWRWRFPAALNGRC